MADRMSQPRLFGAVGARAETMRWKLAVGVQWTGFGDFLQEVPLRHRGQALHFAAAPPGLHVQRLLSSYFGPSSRFPGVGPFPLWRTLRESILRAPVVFEGIDYGVLRSPPHAVGRCGRS